MTEAWRFNLEFAYSRAAAREALDASVGATSTLNCDITELTSSIECFATGEVCESEFAGIRRRTTANGFRYDVMIFV